MNRITSYSEDNGGENPAAIENEIRHTRNRMDETIEQISDKLDPRPYVDDAVDWVKQKGENIDTEALKHTVSEAGQKTGEFVKENPLPLILGGLAIASAFLPSDLFRRKKKKEKSLPHSPSAQEARAQWTTSPPSPQPLGRPMERQLPGGKVMAQRHQTLHSDHHQNGNGSKLQEKAQDLADTARNQWNQTSDAVSSQAHAAKEMVEDTTEQTLNSIRNASEQVAQKTQEAGHQLQRRFENGRQNHPLALCAGAIAAGVVTALLLPRTQRENQICGSQAEQFRQEMKTKGETMLDDSKEALAENNLDTEGLQKRAEAAIDSTAEAAKSTLEESSEPV